MGLFLRGKPEQRTVFPVTPTPMILDFDTFLTGTSADRIEHLKNSDVYTATNIIAGDIAKSSLRTAPNAQENKLVVDLLNKRPDTNHTGYTWLYSITMYTLLYGSAFAIIRRNQADVVTKLEIVSPHTITIAQDTETKELYYEYNDPDTQDITTFPSEDILHFRLNTIDGIVGRSPLSALVPEIEMQKAGTNLLGSYFRKGIFGGAILKLTKGTVNNDVKRQIKKDFESINSGTQNANSVLVLDSSQEYETFTVNTDLLKLIQSNTFSTKQIAKVFGIPLNRFGMELVNSQDGIQNNLYIASTLSGYSRMICDELNSKLGVELEMDFKNLLNDTQDERRKRLFAGESAGIDVLETNEIREYYGYEPLENPETVTVEPDVSRETNRKDDDNGE